MGASDFLRSIKFKRRPILATNFNHVVRYGKRNVTKGPKSVRNLKKQEKKNGDERKEQGR